MLLIYHVYTCTTVHVESVGEKWNATPLVFIAGSNEDVSRIWTMPHSEMKHSSYTLPALAIFFFIFFFSQVSCWFTASVRSFLMNLFTDAFLSCAWAFIRNGPPYNTGGWNQNAGTFLYIRLVPKISWRCKTGSSTFVTLTSVNTLCDLFYSETRKYEMHCLKFTGK